MSIVYFLRTGSVTMPRRGACFRLHFSTALFDARPKGSCGGRETVCRSRAPGQEALQNAQAYGAALFRMKLAAQYAAVGGGGAHGAAAVAGVGQAVGLICGLCLVAVYEIAFLPGRDRGQSRARKIGAAAGGPQAVPADVGHPLGIAVGAKFQVHDAPFRQNCRFAVKMPFVWA